MSFANRFTFASSNPQESNANKHSRSGPSHNPSILSSIDFTKYPPNNNASQNNNYKKPLSARNNLDRRKATTFLNTAISKLFVMNLFQSFRAILSRRNQSVKLQTALKLFDILQRKQTAYLRYGYKAIKAGAASRKRMHAICKALHRIVSNRFRLYKYAFFKQVVQHQGRIIQTIEQKMKQNSIYHLTYTLQRLYRKKSKEYLAALRIPSNLYDVKIKSMKRLVAALRRVFQRNKHIILRKLVQVCAGLESKRSIKNTSYVNASKSGFSNAMKQQVDSSKLELERMAVELKDLQKLLNAKTRLVSELQITLKNKNDVEKKNEQLRKQVSNLRNEASRRQSQSINLGTSRSGRSVDADNRQANRSYLESPRMPTNNSQQGLDESYESGRSQNVLDRSVNSVGSILSQGTYNLLKRLQQQPGPNGACCKYKRKYAEQLKINSETKRKLQLMEAQYQLMAEINRHFQSTIESQINRDNGGMQFEAIHLQNIRTQSEMIRKENDDLKAQIVNYKIQLSNSEKEKDQMKQDFKRKLADIIQKARSRNQAI